MNPSPPKKAKAQLTPGFQKSGLASQLISKLITISGGTSKSCGLPLVATFIENRPRAFWEGDVSAKAAITDTLEALLQAQRREHRHDDFIIDQPNPDAMRLLWKLGLDGRLRISGRRYDWAITMVMDPQTFGF